MAAAETDPPLTLVVAAFGGNPILSNRVGGAIAEAGGALLIDAAEPMRVYEYVLPIPSRTIVSQWKTIEAIHAFVASDIYASDIAAHLGPDHSVVVYNPAFDWDPALPGVWAEPGAPANVSTTKVYHATISEVSMAEGLPFAEAAFQVLDVYRRWGGFPIINRSPIETLSGRWPENRNLLITRWPCQEAFEAWYLGELYQQNVKPRRLVCGRFSLMMFPQAS